jgi:hypothetical protein
VLWKNENKINNKKIYKTIFYCDKEVEKKIIQVRKEKIILEHLKLNEKEEKIFLKKNYFILKQKCLCGLQMSVANCI